MLHLLEPVPVADEEVDRDPREDRDADQDACHHHHHDWSNASIEDVTGVERPVPPVTAHRVQGGVAVDGEWGGAVGARVARLAHTPQHLHPDIFTMVQIFFVSSVPGGRGSCGWDTGRRCSSRARSNPLGTSPRTCRVRDR